MRIPDPKANTTTEAYLAYKAGYLEESELKPVLYEPYLHFDAWLAYWAGLTADYPHGTGKNLTRPFVEGKYDEEGKPVPAETSAWRTPDLIPVGAGEQYIFSNNGTGLPINLYGYNSKKEYVMRIGSGAIPAGSPFTVPEGIAYVAGWRGTGAPKAQLEKGDTITEYEPYNDTPEMLCDEEALVAYLSGVTDTYPEEIKDPYDVRIVGYLRHLASIRWPEPDYPVNNEEFYLSTMDPTHTSNPVPSSDIELDTAEGKIISVEAYGDTYQQTYSGKNLLAPRAVGSTTVNDVVFTVDDTGRVTVNGTASANTYFSLGIPTLPAGDYMLSGLPSTGSGSSFKITFTFGGVQQNCFSVNGKSFTLSAEATATEHYLFIANGYQANNLVFEPMIEKGSTKTSYEPYTGGVPAPNPDYPQAVQTVTGEQTVTVSDGVDSQSYPISLTGKNLWNPTPYKYGYYINNSGAETSSSSASIYGNNMVNPNDTLTLSYTPSVSGNIRIHAYNASGTWLSLIQSSSVTKDTPFSVTFTVPSGATYIRWSCQVSIDDNNLAQLELGSTSTPYIPYSPIELCKIGDYQDYIYKSGDDWYVHKECTHYAFTGDEDWQLRNTQAGSISTFSSNFSGYKFEQVACNNALCNYCTNLGSVSSVSTMYTKGIGFSLYYYTGYVGRSLYINTMDANLPTFKTNISGKLLYYALDTPTDTKITDATLIGQLNALAGADTYNEKTYIKVTATDPNLPALLKVEAYKY